MVVQLGARATWSATCTVAFAAWVFTLCDARRVRSYDLVHGGMTSSSSQEDGSPAQNLELDSVIPREYTEDKDGIVVAKGIEVEDLDRDRTKGGGSSVASSTPRRFPSAGSSAFGMYSFPCSKLQGKYMCGVMMKIPGANTKAVWQEQVSCADSLCADFPDHVCCDTLATLEGAGMLEPQEKPPAPAARTARPVWPPPKPQEAQLSQEPPNRNEAAAPVAQEPPVFAQASAPPPRRSSTVSTANDSDTDAGVTDLEQESRERQPTRVITEAELAAANGECGKATKVALDEPGLVKTTFVHKMPPGYEGEQITRDCGIGFTGTVTFECKSKRWTEVKEKTDCVAVPGCQEASMEVDLNDALDTTLVVSTGKDAAAGETVSVLCSSASNLGSRVKYKGTIDFICVDAKPSEWAVAHVSCKKSRTLTEQEEEEE